MALGGAFKTDYNKEFGISKPMNLDATGNMICTLCEYDGKKQAALFSCFECGQKYFCEDCILLHNENSMTAKHKVESSKPKAKRVVVCAKHKEETVNQYCHQCKRVMCNLCNLTEHLKKKGHNVERLSNYVTTRVRALRIKLDDKKNEFQNLNSEGRKLSVPDGEVEMIKRRDQLIQQVDEYGAKVVSELEQDIGKRFQVLSDMDGCRDRYKESMKEAHVRILSLERTLASPVYDEAFVMTLNALGDKIDNIHPAEEEDISKYFEELKEVIEKNYRFIPEENSPLGRIVGSGSELKTDHESNLATQKKANETGIGMDSQFQKDFRPKLISRLTARAMVDYLCIIDNKYVALAYRTFKEVDIYDTSFNRARTIKCNGEGVRGLATDPGGRIAVLVQNDKDYTIEVYGPESTFLQSSKTIEISGTPWDMGVNLHGDFVILCDFVEESAKVTAIEDGDGKKLTYPEGVSCPFRLACGNGFIFVIGDDCVVVYEMHGSGTKWFKNIKVGYKGTDICATVRGDFFLIGAIRNKMYLEKYQHEDGNGWTATVFEMPGEGVWPHVATSDGQLFVCSQGHDVKLYKA